MSSVRMPEDISMLTHQSLSGKKLILGVTGSSSIYRSIDLARRLIRLGASIKVLMTRFAAKLISPDLFHWATGSKPYVEMSGETEHIDLAKWADALIIAPSTLNTMSKIAHGIGDELLPLTAIAMLGNGKKVVIVPAMNIRLFRSPQYSRAVKLLNEQGAVVIPPFIEEDKAKYPPLNDLVHCIDAVVNRGIDLENTRMLVTAGPTREYIDPVRVITNPSSGLMGILVAREMACRGAIVDLVHGSVNVELPYMVRKYSVDTTEDMAERVRELSSNTIYDAAVFAAAPADYRPVNYLKTKISTRDKPSMIIELQRTPKVIKNLVNRPKVLVAFAAETASGTELVERAMKKYSDYAVDMIIANNVLGEHVGFSKALLDAIVIADDKVISKGVFTKHEVARIIVDYIANRVKGEVKRKDLS
ncbi:MAG: bifunctional phosphopantothenoylcysteine decarboxylase/phosphopantothenate--cysteine ligase CoaBC [Desulfurococcaceae archaeon]